MGARGRAVRPPLSLDLLLLDVVMVMVKDARNDDDEGQAHTRNNMGKE